MAPRKKKTEGKPAAKAPRSPRAPKRSSERPAAADVVDAELVDAEPVEAESSAEPDAVEPDPSELEALEKEVGGDEGADVVEAEVVEGAARPAAKPSRAIVPAAPRGITRQDPLSAYMAEVHRHSLLTREEEYALARRLRDTGDVNAAYKLVAANLRLVVKLAHEYHRNPLSLLDLVQEGNIGLMQAVKKFDPERGVKLSTYAAWWIRAYILRYIMDNWKLVKLGTTEAQRKLFFKLRQEQDRLANQGFEVTPKLLAERLNVTEQDIVEMDQRLGQDEVSLDAPVSEDSTATRLDRMLPSSSAPADERLAGEELKALFRDKLIDFAKTLNDKERYIFDKRLMSDEPMTLQEIGDNYGVSRERARQIEAALITRMREYMREHIPDFDMVAAPKD